MITGGLKIFDANILGVGNGSVVSVSTGEASQDGILDTNSFTFWRSDSSNDSTTETIQITFPASTSIDRIFLIDHNFKEYTIKYNASGVDTDFSNVVGVNGVETAIIAETEYDKNTSYYEFDAVTTTQITISVLKTQVVDAEKYLSQAIATTERGTLVGYPGLSVAKSKNAKKKKSLTGRVISQKSIETFKVNLSFSTYPSNLTADIDLMMDLFDEDEGVLIWLCGGREGSTYFRYTLRGFRLQDVIKMQAVNDFNDTYLKNIYINPVNLSVKLEETA